MGLPFIFKKEIYNLSRGNLFLTQNIILITSSSFYQDSIATDHGSVFSQKFMYLISKNYIYINDIINKFKETNQQIPCITSTYPNSIMIPIWVFKTQLLNISIKNHVLTINRYDAFDLYQN